LSNSELADESVAQLEINSRSHGCTTTLSLMWHCLLSEL